MLLRLFLFLLLGFGPIPGLASPARDIDPAYVAHLLRYIATDYATAVRDGDVANATEYAEMVEFADLVRSDLAMLPAGEGRTRLVAAATRLRDEVGAKSAPAVIAEQARSLSADVRQLFDMRALPPETPDPVRGAELFASQCASCHGSNGQGNGPAAASMHPPPSDFSDRERNDQLTLLDYHDTLAYGVEGTAMVSFADLGEQALWDLSFHVGTLSLPFRDERRIEPGHAFGPFSDLDSVIRTAPAELGSEAELTILAYLRAHPESLQSAPMPALLTARQLLRQSMDRYRAGDPAGAKRLAVAAYLEGFEPSETALGLRDAALLRQLEQDMLEFRRLLGRDSPPQRVAAAQAALDDGLAKAQRLLQDADGTGFSLGFAAATVILLREGLEALLIIIALLAFVKRSGHGSRRSVHVGWASALAAGLLTWLVAAHALEISGVTRELSEGVAALLATTVLLYMGYWLHDKGHALRWQHYLHARMRRSQGRLGSRALGLLAFVAVYREAFETILFLQTLWLQFGPAARLGALAGGATAVAVLAVAGWSMLKLSLRLPIGVFFSISAALMYVLAVVFAGKGIMAIQEAGYLPLSTVPVPRIGWLGIYPSLQSLLLQVVLVSGLVYLLWIRPRTQPPLTIPER